MPSISLFFSYEPLTLGGHATPLLLREIICDSRAPWVFPPFLSSFLTNPGAFLRILNPRPQGPITAPSISLFFSYESLTLGGHATHRVSSKGNNLRLACAPKCSGTQKAGCSGTRQERAFFDPSLTARGTFLGCSAARGTCLECS